MNDATWLERWLPLIRQCATDHRVLELGCGSGRDTELLARAGFRVVAVDVSTEAVEKARLRVPAAEFHCQDVRAEFPPTARGVGAVFASLSLHYFAWAETVALVRRIHDTLGPAGVLLCRLNSTDDHSFGASGFPQIERNFYLVDGQPKRFFDRSDVERLFEQDWHLVSIEPKAIDRYERPKHVWELALRKP